MAAQARIDIVHGGPDHGESVPASRGLLGLASGTEAAIASPVRRLQDELAVEFDRPQAQKWPPIIGIAFVTATSGAFWALAALAIRAL